MPTFPLPAKHAQQNRDAHRTQQRIASEVTGPPPDTRAGLPGDPRALRGIPVVGVRGGLGGAIKGTRP